LFLLRVLASTLWLALALCAFPHAAAAAQPEPQSYGALHWRLIGPFRAGRTVAVSGVPTLPGVFYMAPNNGGVWKSTDYGRTWNPLFDAQDTGSIGALAVAPSDPNVVYVGSGEGLRRPDLSTGDGMYKSSDGGKSWLHLGLRDGQQIAQIAVDPHDTSRLFVAVVGHPYGPNAERGLYRSTDGGVSFAKVLGSGDDVGAVGVVIDPHDSHSGRRATALGISRKCTSASTRAVYSNRRTAERRGTSLRAVCPRRSAELASPFHRPIPSVCTRSSRKSKAAASTVRATRASPGRKPRVRNACADARKISRGSRQIPKTATRSIPPTRRRIDRATAGSRGPASRAHPAATITIPYGSIPRTRT